MKTLPIDDHNQGIFSHKLGHFFLIFDKGQERPPTSPAPPLVTRLVLSDLFLIVKGVSTANYNDDNSLYPRIHRT